MKPYQKTLRVVLILSQILSCGCARTASVDVLGSFFPVWMFCVTGGVLATNALRILLARMRLADALGPRAIIYPSMTALFTCFIWMVAFHD